MTTQNLCPVCETRIRKNAKACILHRAQAVLEHKDTGILLRSHTPSGAKAKAQHTTQVTEAKANWKLQKLKDSLFPCIF